jgi:large subunit ribosomal protein L24
VEGVNLVKKHERKTQDNPQGSIIEREASIHLSNVKKSS